MFNVAVVDAVFVLCALTGVILLLITVAVHDLRGVLAFLHADFGVGGTSLVPLLLGFVSMFGVGGLAATRLVGLHGGGAILGGAIAGVAGAILAIRLVDARRRADNRGPVSMRDLVGGTAWVAVQIPAGRFGSVYVRAEGQIHEYSATSSVDIPAGADVTVTAALGNGLVVAAIEPRARSRLLSDEGDRAD